MMDKKYKLSIHFILGYPGTSKRHIFESDCHNELLMLHHEMMLNLNEDRKKYGEDIHANNSFFKYSELFGEYEETVSLLFFIFVLYNRFFFYR